jgi:hypothetical protein
MDKKLGWIENKILLYFKMVAYGCKGYVDSCDYTPYYCGYSEAREKTINTYELCLFVANIIKCPGEVEIHYTDKHDDCSYKSVLRAVKSLERKGYIKRKKRIARFGNSDSKWFMLYELDDH